MGTAVIVEAVRTPIGRRGGALADLHAAEILGAAQVALLEKALTPRRPSRSAGGCVRRRRAAQRTHHQDRVAARGLPYQTGCLTLDAQCGSGQQAVHLIAGLGASRPTRSASAWAAGWRPCRGCRCRSTWGTGVGTPRPDSWDIDLPNQFVAAERIAERRGLTRAEIDDFGLRSQTLAQAAWAQGFDREITPVKAAGGLVDRDGGLRATSLDALARLNPVVPGGAHTGRDLLADLRRRGRRAAGRHRPRAGAWPRARGPGSSRSA